MKFLKKAWNKAKEIAKKFWRVAEYPVNLCCAAASGFGFGYFLTLGILLLSPLLIFIGVAFGALCYVNLLWAESIGRRRIFVRLVRPIYETHSYSAYGRLQQA